MALATRELELVIIARDRASAVLARIGGALTILGSGAARLGAEGLGFFADVTQESIEFRKQVALAFTQAEIAGVEFNDVLNLIRETARNTAVPIDELTESAFDIFSTLTLDNIGQARDLLNEFSESAIAGQAPIRDVGRATIAWLNALNLAPTAENAHHILGNLFELVRKGAGTYEEFAAVIGKAIPPFVAANQNVETFSASLAFLTRNGLSAAEASTSAARAVELLYSAKAIKGLTNIGIAVEDINGKFRPMDELLADVVEHFKGMSDAERKLEFKNIFGEGRIQARRFFDLLLNEGNFEEFLFLLGEMEQGADGLAQAFDIMTAEPAVQLEYLRNRFQVLRQEIGDAFIPFLTGKLIPWMDRLLDVWESLDEVQKSNIVKWAAYGTAFITIGGALTAIVGSVILLLGLLKAFTGSLILGAALGGGLAAVIGGIAAAIVWAIVDWEGFMEVFDPWWDKAIGFMEPVLKWVQDKFPGAWAATVQVWERLPAIWDQIKHSLTGQDFGNEIDDLPQGVQDVVFLTIAALQGIQTFFTEDWPVIWQGAEEAVNGFFIFMRSLWLRKIVEPMEGFFSWMGERWPMIWEDIKAIFSNFVNADWKPLWDQVKEEVEGVVPAIFNYLVALYEVITAAFGFIVGAVLTIWHFFGDDIIEGMRIIVEAIVGLLTGLAENATGVMNIITGILTLDWDKASTGFAQIGQANLGLVGLGFETLWNTAAWTTGAIDSALELSKTKFGDWRNTVMADFAKVASNAEYNGGRVRRALNDLSPWTPHSPPLVEQMRTGFAAMSRTVHKNLMYIEKQANRFAPSIQDVLGGIAPQGLLPTNPIQRLQPAMAGVGSVIETNIERQVLVDKLESKADPIEIAEEIAWKAMNS